MPIVRERTSDRPLFFTIKDENNNGVLRAIVGFEVTNNVTTDEGVGIPIFVTVAYGPNQTQVDWWTPLGRSNNHVQPGEEIVASGFRVAPGLGTLYVSFGQV